MKYKSWEVDKLFFYCLLLLMIVFKFLQTAHSTVNLALVLL